MPMELHKSYLKKKMAAQKTIDATIEQPTDSIANAEVI
jgi:hypothetical protein